jgi:hypothetical protein
MFNQESSEKFKKIYKVLEGSRRIETSSKEFSKRFQNILESFRRFENMFNLDVEYQLSLIYPTNLKTSKA